MADTPTLNGQDIGQAERATRAVLDALLAETSTSFQSWVTLNVLATQPLTPGGAGEYRVTMPPASPAKIHGHPFHTDFFFF